MKPSLIQIPHKKCKFTKKFLKYPWAKIVPISLGYPTGIAEKWGYSWFTRGAKEEGLVNSYNIMICELTWNY